MPIAARAMFVLMSHSIGTCAAFGGAARRVASMGARARMTMATVAVARPPPPITVLGGFLGTGKTTALQHVLSNNEGRRIGLIVNDVAAVNIDAKLIKRTSGAAGAAATVELQNGCACCSIADELLPAVASLVALGEERHDGGFDSIVVELSGVANPDAVRGSLEAGGYTVARSVTLLDAAALPAQWNSWDEMGSRADLAGDGGAGSAAADPCSASRRVVELLTDQIEAADALLLNKADLATPDELATSRAVCEALNPAATTHVTEFGAIGLEVPGRGRVRATCSSSSTLAREPA